MLEDVGGAQGADGGVVQAVVTDDDVKHAVALLAVETEDRHVAERHAREQVDDLCLAGLQIHVAADRRWDEHAVGHVKPVAVVMALHVGLDAQMGSQMIEKTDVEIGDMAGQLLQQLHCLLDVAEQRVVALGLLDDMGQQFADE